MVEITTPKVLIVEDEESWRTISRNVLSSAGYLVRSAAGYEEALHEIEQHFFHAVVVDLRLVDPDPENEQGVMVMDKLLEMGEKTGLIVLTGYPTIERVRDSFKKYQVIDFLSKDTFDPSQLLAASQQAVKPALDNLRDRMDEYLSLSNLVRKHDLADIERKITRRPTTYLEEILKNLAHPIIPFLVDERHERIDTSRDLPVFETCYWSRLLGQAVFVRMGHRAQIQGEVDSLERNGKDVFSDTRQSVSGLRYIREDISFSQFK